MYYNNIKLYILTKDTNTKVTVASELDEPYISIFMFQNWEDHLTFRNLDAAGDKVWLRNYLQWAQSPPYLKANFERLRYNLTSLTVRFAELLLEYASQLPVPTVDRIS